MFKNFINSLKFDIYVYLYYRFHAEFQLNEPPYNPFWFTPGQFTGNLIISRDYNRILNFNIHVPAAKKLNVGKLREITHVKK
jgi:hypothetical protein